jgi:predicted heme/steroid binding protein
VKERLISALKRAARLEQTTATRDFEVAAAAEREHWAAELRCALGRVSEPERTTPLFRALAAELELPRRSEPGEQRPLDAGRLATWAERAEALGSRELALALRARVARRRELDRRLAWLEHGTLDAELARLDPERDSDQIYVHLLRTFRVESRIVETLAINRVATWPSLALFLRSTREAEQRPLSRFLDTYALFANFFEWGAESARGSASIRRINQIHGRYYLPNDGMKYVLLDTVFTWLDGIERIGHRPLGRVEREGFFQAHLRLGRAMQIAELSSDSNEMCAWFRRINAERAVHTPFKTKTFETFVGNSFGSATEERDALLLAARVAMDDDYRAALGYAAPTPDETQAVRDAVRAVAADAPALRGGWLRSLERTPLSSEPRLPEQIGVSARAAPLPQAHPGHANAGYPEGQTPALDATSAAGMHLPLYSWEEIRREQRKGNTWIVLDGDVYDVSGWLEQHPGGAARLREWAGRDATLEFAAAPHDALTRVLRLNYRIGRLDPESRDT